MAGGAALGAQVARVSCDSRGRGADRWPMDGAGCAERARTAPAGPAVRVQAGSGGQERQVERVRAFGGMAGKVAKKKVA